MAEEARGGRGQHPACRQRSILGSLPQQRKKKCCSFRQAEWRQPCQALQASVSMRERCHSLDTLARPVLHTLAHQVLAASAFSASSSKPFSGLGVPDAPKGDGVPRCVRSILGISALRTPGGFHGESIELSLGGGGGLVLLAALNSESPAQAHSRAPTARCLSFSSAAVPPSPLFFLSGDPGAALPSSCPLRPVVEGSSWVSVLPLCRWG